MTDFPDWQAPQAHADAINTTGVPLIRNATVIATGLNVNAGATSVPVTYQYPAFAEGYLIEVIPQHPGVRIFVCDVLISHLDASDNVLAVEQVTMSNWQNAGNNTATIRGRLLGTQLTLQAQVGDSAFLNTITGGAVTADAIRLRACALYTYIPNTGKRVPIITGSDGLLLGSQDTVALTNVVGNTALVAVLPDYTGAVVVSSFTTLGGGFIFRPRISSFTVANGTAPLAVQEFPATQVNLPQFSQFSLPSAFNVAYVIQQSTVANSAGFNVLITAADQ